MPKPSEQAQIDFIVDYLRKGEQRGKVLAKFVKKWQGTSARTFDRRLRQAEAALQAEQKRIKASAEQDVAKEVEARKSNIMTAIDRMELLNRIANGEVKVKQPFVIGGKIMEYPSEPTFTERRAAIAELNKMDGSYAPTKVAQTDADGNDLCEFVLPNGTKVSLK